MLGLIPAVASGGLAGIVLAHGLAWTTLNVIAIRPPRLPTPHARGRAFAVIIPAHNEEKLLGQCIVSIQAEGFTPAPRVVVIADNCDDTTAVIARDLGVEVVERNDLSRRGKSHALRAGLDYLRCSGAPPEAVVFIDADNVIEPGFFGAQAAAFEDGATVTQAFYGALPATTALGNLRSLALRLVHWGRPLGAVRIGLGSTIKGSGMAMTWGVVPVALRAGGLAEDAGMTVALAREGHSVTFVPGARPHGYFAQTYRDARTQDERWERGRLGLLREAGGASFHALRHGRPAAAAGALEVASLPLSLLVLTSLAAAGLAVVSGSAVARIAAGAAGLSLAAYVVTGVAAARPPWREVLGLASAPRFILYKLMVYARIARSADRGWERTRRV